MKIQPLWLICLSVRLLIILLIYYINTNTKYKKLIKIINIIFLLTIGCGFIYKGYTGSNNENQIAKVFWHDSRYVHGILYILSSSYLLNDNLNIALLLLLLDVIFSILYRILFNK
jgi:L-asparagine transporter-like permease